jgi:hypothetical protein
LKNPFWGFAGVQSLAIDLYTKKDIYVTDGGLNINDPIWSFLTPTRQGREGREVGRQAGNPGSVARAH